MVSTIRQKIKLIVAAAIIVYGTPTQIPTADASPLPFSPGEKLKYALRWGNIPAGKLELEVLPITTVNGEPAYHFVMKAKSNSTVDIFCKIRDRIDAFADTQMTRSVLYLKERRGRKGMHKEETRFDWAKGQVQFSDLSRARAPIALQQGSFDPLSAFYYTRMAITAQRPEVKRPVTDGKRSFIGNARLVGRESVTLLNGRRYDTLILEPDIGLLGGILKSDEKAKLRVWVTDDDKRIPILIKAKAKIGHFIGELVSAEGV